MWLPAGAGECLGPDERREAGLVERAGVGVEKPGEPRPPDNGAAVGPADDWQRPALLGQVCHQRPDLVGQRSGVIAPRLVQLVGEHHLHRQVVRCRPRARAAQAQHERRRAGSARRRVGARAPVDTPGQDGVEFAG